MSPVLAYITGFTFSFAWTPCVGPALSSVLIMASGSLNSLVGNLLVLVYTAGFVIPFLLLGIFTTQALNFLKKHQKLLKYTVKAGGVILILIGIMTFTGWMNGVSSYFNRFTASPSQEDNTYIPTPTDEQAATPVPTTAPVATAIPAAEAAPTDSPDTTPGSSSDNSAENKKHPEFDFTLTDQYGKEHTLSDYKGKVVFLNFWATWCGPCKQEMPDIEELYNEYGKNEGDVIILGVANPASDEYPNNSDVSASEVEAFLEDNNYTFPVVFDQTGDVLQNYYISAFPTTFVIDKEGNIYGYATGTLTKDIMVNAIEQALASTD
jgi:cytochrome c-type biogenesis protein